jgi:potassium efflux system protein
MKVKIFMLIVTFLLVLVWTFHKDFKEEGETIYIAFIGPMSGEGKAAGEIMSNAIKLYLEEVNAKKELKGKKVELKIFDDQNKCDPGEKAEQQARRIVKENQVVAVIGHWYSSCSITGGKIYKRYGIPAITPGSVNVKVTQGNDWYFRNIYNASASGRFLAYYVNKVFRLNKVTIIDDGSGYGSYLAEVFEQAARGLGMEVKNRWRFKSNEKNKEEKFKGFVEKLKQDGEAAGAILLATQASEGIPLVELIKDAGIQNRIISGSGFSEQTFVDGFKEFPKEKANPGHYTNDIYVATPLIFDTANEKAQNFKAEYQAKYQEFQEDKKELQKEEKEKKEKKELDWSAAYAYDSAMVLIEAIKRVNKNLEGTQLAIKADRQKIRDELAKFTIHEAVEGTTGFNYFNKNRDAPKPVVIGVYKNKKIVSALTQFQVVRNINEIADLDEAIKNERVLKIGEQYMYKTNVVYTGIKINQISDFKPDNLTFTLDFHLWFRSAGNFDPLDIEFLNALEPDKIEAELKNKPLDKRVTKDQITYRLYRIKSSFRADFRSSHYAYKQHKLSVNFRHKSLTRNNLIYVTDVRGIGDANQVSEQLQNSQVLNPASGWSIDQQIRFFPNVAERNSLGNPEYLNVQGGKVEYSQFNTSVQIKKNEITLRGRIPYPYAYQMMVLSTIFILLLNVLSKRFRKWSKWVWFFQAFLAVILLLSAEVLLVKWLSKDFEAYSMKFVIMIFDILWWIIPAFLLNLASESFIWTPIEEKTGRLIPNIVRLFLAFIIYFMAVVGIIAFVYDQQLTSILATSGVIAMIIGLAIQINISNIFSGIAINIERPFRIRDWVKIGNFEEGEIVDITWRTTRLKTRAECILSIPNSMASESPILNLNYPDDVYWLWPTVYVHPMHPPTRVKKLLLDALLSADKVLKAPAPVVLFTGINEWAASYWIAFCADDYADKHFILEDVWTRVWFHLNRAGITPAVQRQEIHLFKGVKERGGEEATKPITLLQEVDIFKPFSEEAKLYLSDRIRRHRFGPSDVIVQQGDAGDSLFIIVEGVVGVQVQSDDGRTKEVARLGAGDFFGEMALLTGEERTATVIALVDTYLFELTQADIAPLIAQQPEVSERVSKVLTQRHKATQSQMHVEDDVEIETKAPYLQILNKIEHFFGLRDEQ